MQDEWLSIEQFAAEIGVPIKTVYGWRSRGAGPRGATFGRHVRFRRSDVDGWVEQQYADRQPAA